MMPAIDREFKFDEHVSNICKKVNQKSDIIFIPENLKKFF